MRLVVCGGTGSGKSAVCNTLLGSPEFPSGTGPHPVTRSCAERTARLHDRTVTVVDTPSTEEADLEDEFRLPPSGLEPQVFLLVTPLGFPGGKALLALRTMEKLLGQEVEKFTVVLFSGGDQDWAAGEKDRDMEQVLTLCGHRQQVFNNRSDDRAQVLQLFSIIDGLLEDMGWVGGTPEQWLLEDLLTKNQLPVTCGEKSGMLHQDKLANGEKCVESEGKWFTPTKFEQFANMQKQKNWKRSIRFFAIPLFRLIKQGLLTSPRHYKAPKDLEQTSAPGSPPAGEGTLCRVRLSPQWFSEPCEGEDTDLWDQEGDHGEGPLPRRKQEILHKNHRKASGEGTCSRPSKVQSGNVKRRKNGKIAEVNRSQKTSSLPVAEVPVDAQARQPNINKKAEPETLPVTCGPARGVLHKSRFASGTIGKCIRTERSWFTPEDFLREDVNLVNGLWRRDILSDGKPLSELLEKEILVIHSVLCECFVCKGNPKDQGNDDVCFICGQDTELVCCDKCPRTFHYACHLPTLEESSLGDKWLCTFCLVEKVAQLQSPMTRQQVLDSPISTYKLHCQCLILCLMKEDTDLVFLQDPLLTTDGYAEVIRSPMWIEKITAKLLYEYRSVTEFVSDVDLIFENCAKFHKNNSFGLMGAKIKRNIHEKFQAIFSIQ